LLAEYQPVDMMATAEQQHLPGGPRWWCLQQAQTGLACWSVSTGQPPRHRHRPTLMLWPPLVAGPGHTLPTTVRVRRSRNCPPCANPTPAAARQSAPPAGHPAGPGQSAGYAT
jgi:hypothetical protein